jgi:competence ComEA-like helix-hairpin-helix protein
MFAKSKKKIPVTDETPREVGPLRAAWARLRSSRWAPVGLKLAAIVACIVGLGFVGSGVCDRWLAVHPAKASSALVASSATVATSVAAPESSATASSSAAATASASAGSAACDLDGKIVLNTATSSEIEKLPGIGPSKAEKIIELRTKLGKFARLEDLYRIKGIKKRLLDKIRPHVLLDPPPGCG